MQPPAITALSVPVSGTPRLIRLIPSLENIQAEVQGNIEEVSINSEASLYLNETGKIESLDVNENANRLAEAGQIGLAPGDLIVGPVLVTGRLNREGVADGADHDVPSSVLDLCKQANITVEPLTV